MQASFPTSLIALFWLLSVLAPLQSQDIFETQTVEDIPCAPLIGNIGARHTQSLNGTWNALIDPSVFSLNDRFHYLERNYKPEPSELVEANLEDGLTLRVPGDWNTQDTRLVFYNGKVWYKRDFYVKKKDNKRYFLHFGAINYKAQIYVNGEHVASHTGGYTSFNCEVTKVLKEGENLLVIKVNNALTSDDIPTTSTDWMNYGGITRDVDLVEMPAQFIRNYKIQLAPKSIDRIEGWVNLEGMPTGSVNLEIPELNIRKTFPVTDGRARVSLDAKPELWSPEQPTLYTVRISAGPDAVEDQIGFRTIAVEDGQVVLNGKPVFLKGISIHEEAIGANGRASSEREAAELLTYAKELNCNFVRLAHYTHNEYMARQADKMGILVWSEIPVYWSVNFASPAVLEMAKTRMDEMIARDQNRASIIFWSLGNETPESEARNTFFGNLNKHVKSLDDTRLTTAALIFNEEIQAMARDYYFPTLAGKEFDVWDIEINDPLAEIVDVAAINQYFGWYYSGFLAAAANLPPYQARKTMLENIPKIRFHVRNNKPFVFSEMGAGAKRGKTADEEDLVVYSEEYQAKVYQNQVEMVKQQSGLVGMSPWILKDFRSSMRLYQGVQDYWNLKGLITDNGERKKAFFVLQDFYGSWGAPTVGLKH
ncbi:glycoside hydrolase family 2 TIM barrel-domain containing protein [Flavilitoribacter nigricans]|uniref:Beta-glucuronidase n=1 Tax=Flavilitoribacter nigricans (strain ATCC 23147 / DSM 23189 / NBRC 102662 / NCIMB 1420 / SS-2) TaxID=1122177 RepID=A0A2D0MX95_FLAN2|nr:glycoside hydrolase family 2 TIM barrel-domain containing protein [Flavilitoribacter nigricans]PHN00855.1 beta-glucuronidase [Flavilitoribacter nigricans DSM 23189 = NBRC 102662]